MSKVRRENYSISPLGAAIVEAMPDRAKVRQIECEFKKHGRCPPSVLFTQQEATVWARTARAAGG